MKNNHIHKYERRRLGSFKKTGHEIYKCAVPGCNHYIVSMELVVGRFSQCWGKIDCPHKVEMTRYMVFNEKRKRPICDACKEERRLDRMTPEQLKQEMIKQEAINRMLAVIESGAKLNMNTEEDDGEVYDEF